MVIINDRTNYIDTLRGIAIVIMIMGHVGFSHVFSYYIHMFHMPIWFFVSGWFFRETNQSIVTIVKKRFKSILLPYLIWGLVQYPLWILLVYNEGEDITEPIKNLLFYNTNLVMPIAGALWFLTCLFFAEIIFIVIKRFIINEKVVAIFVCTISIIGCSFYSFFGIRLPWALDTSFVAVGFIWLGYIIKKHINNKIIGKLLNISVPLTLFLFLVNIFMCFLNDAVNLRTASYGNIALFWINAIFAILIYWNISKYIDSLENQNSFMKKVIGRIRGIGKNSIMYLCLNQIVILCFELFAQRIGMYQYHWIIPRTFIFIFSMTVLIILEKVTMNNRIKVLFGK